MAAVLAPFAQSMSEAAQAALPGSGLAWLDTARAEALAAFLRRGLPDTHNELWKYTSLRALGQRRYAGADAEAETRAVAADLIPEPARAAQRIVFVNGVFRADLSRLDALPEGITVRALSHALRDQPEPLRFLLTSRAEGADDGFTLLNRALAADGLILRVAAGTTVAAPLHVVHVGVAAEPAAAWHFRSLVELGEDASLQLVEHHVADAAAAHLGNLVREVHLRDRAHLDWNVVQTAAPDAQLFRRSDVLVQEDALLDYHALELGGKLARHELRIDLGGRRARFEGRGAFIVHGRQHADSEILVTHRGLDTVSSAIWRGVADGRAHGVVHGRILVKPGADGADGGFFNKNLLLSEGAEIDTRPALEIYADEVQANHGATVGQLDEQALFYLRSRGVPFERARQMLVRAFCAVALDGMAAPELRAYCDALLAAHLPGDEA